MIEEDKKIEFYKNGFIGAPLSEYIGFRCTKRLSSWLRAQWVGNLNNGLEQRHEVLLGFSESAENKALFTDMTGFG